MTFTDKMTAEHWLSKERQLIERASIGGDPWVSPAERVALNQVVRESLDDYAKRWIAQRNIKERTRIHYTSILHSHISPKLGKIAVSNLTGQTVRSWYAATLTDRPTLRSHAYQLLHAICGTALTPR
jgi:hypothetical protein